MTNMAKSIINKNNNEEKAYRDEPPFTITEIGSLIVDQKDEKNSILNSNSKNLSTGDLQIHPSMENSNCTTEAGNQLIDSPIKKLMTQKYFTKFESSEVELSKFENFTSGSQNKEINKNYKNFQNE